MQLTVLPANSDTGIEFHRIDVSGRDAIIPARFDTVNDTNLCTRIANTDGVEVSTIEHLMAAFAGCGVHNAIVELDGSEVPIMDGSSDRFVQEILATGVKSLDRPVKILQILHQVSVTVGDAYAAFVPSNKFEIDFQIDYDDSAIGVQRQTLNMKNGSFVRELSNCRTFCLQSDVEGMKIAGLA
ncbi:MAG: UDP-3-O-acyl-N-acetylglucosamine deacetylase, partial [Alphaproteobacteria bacterium]